MNLLQHSKPDEADLQKLSRLSDTEWEVFEAISKGMYGTDLCMINGRQRSHKTIESHYAHMKQKLGVTSTRQLVVIAVKTIMFMEANNMFRGSKPEAIINRFFKRQQLAA